MSSPSIIALRPTVGIIGFGAFGRLIARHLAPHASVRAYDPLAGADTGEADGVRRTNLQEAARCAVVILAVPVASMAEVVAAIAPDLLPGTLVVDVGSVKMLPAEAMRAGLPPHVDILGTHPLFGPQSASGGIAGLKIALCPVRGRRWRRAAAFLRKVLRLTVIVTTPEAHDREAAISQGLTHFLAKVFVAMEPLPTRMTTRSFEAIMQAVEMVRHDAPEVLEAIERLNPYAAEVRQRFFALAARVETDLARAPGAAASTRPYAKHAHTG